MTMTIVLMILALKSFVQPRDDFRALGPSSSVLKTVWRPRHPPGGVWVGGSICGVVFVISDEWYEFVGWSGEGLSSALGLDSSDLVVAAREDFRDDGERPVPEF